MAATSTRISLPRNITNAHSLEELKLQLGEFVSKLEDYLNTQIGIHFLDKITQRPTLLPGDLVFDFTNHPEFATLQQWNGQKLVPLALSSFGGYIDLVAQGIGSGPDSSLFLRSDGAGHWVLAAGPVGPAGPAGDPGDPGAPGADGISAYQVAVNNGFVGDEAAWLLSLVGPPGADGADGPPGADGAPGADGVPGVDGDDGSIWYNGAGVPGGGLGIDGDYYLRTSNGDVYFKVAGVWSVILNIMGPAGAAGAAGADGADGADGAPGPGFIPGTGNPDNSIGVDGQLYVNDQNGDIFFKIAGVWILYGANAWRLQGKYLDSSTVAPPDGYQLYYDQSLFSGVGGWRVGAPGSGVTRGSISATTSSLANNAVDSATTIATGKMSTAIKVVSSAAAWIRIYATAAKQTADLARSITADPGPNSGCLLDVYLTSSMLTLLLAPALILFNDEGTPTANLPMTVKNLSGATAAITVTVTRLITEG